MCDPISFATFAIGAASQVAGFMGASADAKRQNQLAENNRIESNRAATDQYAAIQQRLLQEQKSASQAVQANNLEGAKARGSASVAAGEAGVTGLSVDSLLNDYNAQQGTFERTTTNNLEATADQLRAEADGIKANTGSRINSVQKAAKPSFLPYAIGVASSGLDAYTGSIKRKTQQ